jgi:CheY-like chemotaxis protein
MPSTSDIDAPEDESEDVRHVGVPLESDLGLPHMTGYELMKHLKARYNLKGIAMSGYAMEEDIRRGEEAGFSARLVKPLDIARLEISIRHVAGKGS